MAINKTTKSNRLLQSRRYTQDALGDSQEAFTQVLDLSAAEIYSQQNLIPTSSLPYSGSSQNGQFITSGGENILKFWYRQRLAPTDTLVGESGNYNIWFFLSPTQSTDYTLGVNPGVLSSRQQGSFISPKYAPTLGGNTEDTPPSYQVTLTSGSTFVDPSTYTFDYKTGVLQFNNNSGVTSITTPLYITAYQYVGKTLASDKTAGYSGSFSGSFQGNSTGTFTGVGSGSFSGSFQGNSTGVFTGSFSGSLQGAATLNNLTLTGSFNHTGSYNLIGNITQTGSLNQSGSINVVGAIISNGINVVDNAIAMAIALG